ncbi:MAG: hypothetical protein K2X86_00605 [Cytophagaceae bacterium]|nr:hypothetical protein [Cytophagaceae bacterium]
MVDHFSGDHILHKMVSSDANDTPSKPKEPVSFSKPNLSIKKEGFGVVIKFEKGDAEAVRIYSKRSYEENFTLLANVSGNFFIDSRPNTFNAPELREYIAYFVADDKQIGQPSDVVLIIKK